jgi:hypothetical protein
MLYISVTPLFVTIRGLLSQGTRKAYDVKWGRAGRAGQAGQAGRDQEINIAAGLHIAFVSQ